MLAGETQRDYAPVLWRRMHLSRPDTFFFDRMLIAVSVSVGNQLLRTGFLILFYFIRKNQPWSTYTFSFLLPDE
jgi:hypothetical protein